MRINQITYTPRTFCGKKSEKTEKKTISPIKAGLTTTAIWLGFGFAFQEVTNRLSKAIKSDKKASIIINVGCAVIFGAIDTVRAVIRKKHLDKNKKN